MKTPDYLIFDLETGGFLAEMETVGLCEIAAIIIDCDTLEEKERYEAIIAPHKLANGNISIYNQGALNVNGLTLSKINAGVDSKQVANDLAEMCKRHSKSIKGGTGKVIPVGHNIDAFDLPWLSYFLDLHKVNISDIMNNFTIDTMWWSRLRWSQDGSIPNHKLATSCQEAGINLVDGHRAMADVESNTELLKHFLKSLRNEGEGVVKKVEAFRETFKID